MLPFETSRQIGPDACVSALIAASSWPTAHGAVLLVGHQPVLGRLASLLLAGQEVEGRSRRARAMVVEQPRPCRRKPDRAAYRRFDRLSSLRRYRFALPARRRVLGLRNRATAGVIHLQQSPTRLAALSACFASARRFHMLPIDLPGGASRRPS